jgi:hypothetical protein
MANRCNHRSSTNVRGNQLALERFELQPVFGEHRRFGRESAVSFVQEFEHFAQVVVFEWVVGR